MEGTDRAYFPGLGTPHNSGTVTEATKAGKNVRVLTKSHYNHLVMYV